MTERGGKPLKRVINFRRNIMKTIFYSSPKGESWIYKLFLNERKKEIKVVKKFTRRNRIKIKIGQTPDNTRIYLLAQGKSYEIPRVKNMEVHVQQDALTYAKLTLLVDDVEIDFPTNITEKEILNLLNKSNERKEN